MNWVLVAASRWVPNSVEVGYGLRGYAMSHYYVATESGIETANHLIDSITDRSFYFPDIRTSEFSR